MIKRPAANPQVACVLAQAECRKTPPLLRSGGCHMLAKQAVLAEPSEASTARRAPRAGPASSTKGSRRSGDRSKDGTAASRRTVVGSRGSASTASSLREEARGTRRPVAGGDL